MTLMQPFFDFLSRNENEILYGTFVWLAGWIAKRAWDYVKRLLLNAKYRGFCGDFTVYSFAEDGSGRLSAFKYQIRFRFGRLVVTGGSANCRYTGEATVTENALYLRLEGVHHTELIQTVWARSAQPNANVLYGVGSAINGIFEPIAYKAIMIRGEIEEENAIQLLRQIPASTSEGMTLIHRTPMLTDWNHMSLPPIDRQASNLPRLGGSGA
jgi:hypothetical protein